MAKPASSTPFLLSKGHTDSVNCLAALQQHGASVPFLLASGSDDGKVLVWRMNEGALHTLVSFTAPSSGGEGVEPINCLAWLKRDASLEASGQRPLLLVGVGCKVLVLELDASSPSLTLVSEFDCFAEEVTAIATSEEHCYVAVVDDEGSITVLDLSKGQGAPAEGKTEGAAAAAGVVLQTIKNAHSPMASAAAWRPAGAETGSGSGSGSLHPLLLTGGFDHKLILWDALSGASLFTWNGPAALAPAVNASYEKAIAASSASASASPVASSSSGSAAAAGPAAKGKKGKGSNAGAGAAASASTTEGKMFNPPFVHALSWSSEGKSFLAGFGDGSVQLYDLSGGPYAGELSPSRLAAVAAEEEKQRKAAIELLLLLEEDEEDSAGKKGKGGKKKGKKGGAEVAAAATCTSAGAGVEAALPSLASIAAPALPLTARCTLRLDNAHSLPTVAVGFLGLAGAAPVPSSAIFSAGNDGFLRKWHLQRGSSSSSSEGKEASSFIVQPGRDWMVAEQRLPGGRGSNAVVAVSLGGSVEATAASAPAAGGGSSGHTFLIADSSPALKMLPSW